MELQDDDGDAHLLSLARGGDRAAFAGLLVRHLSVASGVCLRLLRGDQHAVDDVLQETAVVALVSLDRLRDPDQFGSWLCGIALNMARRHLRETQRESPAPVAGVEVADGARGPAERAEVADIGRRVRAAISHLAAGQRDAVMLFYLQGLTHREVAAELDITINAVKARLHQARATLEPHLAPLSERREPSPMTTDSSWIDARINEVRRGAEDQGEAPLGQPHVVVLSDAETERALPIWIGRFEAISLATTLDSVDMPRPMIYQFAANLLHATGWQPKEVRITALAAGVFYAQVVLERDDREVTVDARPSDALNLAALSGAPIRVARDLWDDDAATSHEEWRAYAASTADLADESRERNRIATEWLQSIHDTSDDLSSDTPTT